MSNENLTKLIDNFNQLNFASCQKLADMSDPGGTYRLGYFYEYGIDVEKDENKAFTYYQKSADMNDSNGMYQVGYWYHLGIGVEVDKHKAFTYYLKSAETGNSMGIRKTAIFTDMELVYSGYEKCAHCNEDNTDEAWCLSCDPDMTTRWTSKNKVIDDCMKEFQLRARAYEDAIEWIPFNRLSDVKEIGKGGFGFVYSATWLDGVRKVNSYKRSRKPSSTVALKTLTNSEENKVDFLKEFKSLMECKLQRNSTKLAIYGITQNTKTNEFLMVFQYANNGSLYKYLKRNFSKLTWQAKLHMLKDISDELDNIHIAKYDCLEKKDEKILEEEIYGVMPYVAPEVLLGKKFTQAADIYGFGIIMTEISTGQRPFDGVEFSETKLAIEICRGLRPKFAPGTPKCYIELAEKCMNSDPLKRPSASNVLDSIRSWLTDSEIKNQFLEADKAIKPLPIPKHPDEMYTSKIISTKLILKTIKDLSQSDSTQINLDIAKV
ncbi:kinase-like domain-containing protein [Gigaspora rosea]|uniref:Kinase-like domain-containing protein n=1 Tax=Gigaspora rosea TaxID=44941 RepID=A0A397VHL0_9GLOM|nr:kinase-like domain-containing protein [Gigaspora rosea]